MGWRISELVTVALPEGGLDRTVAFVLSLYANNETGEGIRPSMETVARRALCHPESARRCVKNLVRLGWLREIRRGTGGAMGQAEYAFDLGRLQHSNPGAGVHGFNPSAGAWVWEENNSSAGAWVWRNPSAGADQPQRPGWSTPAPAQGNPSRTSIEPSVSLFPAGANGRKGAQEPTLIPDSLDTPDFRAAWAEWERHRAEMRHKLTPTSTRQQLRRLEDMGHDNAISAIQHSIANGYRGIFPPNERRGETRPRGGRQAARPPRAARRGEYAEKLSAEAIPTLNGRGGA